MPKVSVAEVTQALAVLFAIEPDPADPEGPAKYRAALVARADEVAASRATLKKFATQQQSDLASLQKAFYSVSNLPIFANNHVAAAVARAELNDAFAGVGEWRR